jgi:GNAT superfamily N-acetyltransferase
MDVKVLHDKAIIFNYLKSNPGLYIYSIGDLDDFYWPKTIWFALEEYDTIRSIALLYFGGDTPVLLAFCEEKTDHSYRLLERIKNILPVRFNAHLSPGLIDVFGRENITEDYGLSCKMILTKIVNEKPDSHIRRLSVDDLPVIRDFYTVSYPQNWFDSRMLETNKYFGYFFDNRLVGVSGIHIYSEEYKVAALGNIATHPDYRGQQIGYKLTSALCYDLQKSVDLIGLNVKTDNKYAIRCYEKTGLKVIATYEECCIKNG